MLHYTASKYGLGTWGASCVQCSRSIEVAGDKNGIAIAAIFLDGQGWRRDARRGRGRDRCEWSCPACRARQEQPKTGSASAWALPPDEIAKRKA